MKKLSFKLMLLLMGVLAASTFTACSDDDEPKNPAKSSKVSDFITEYKWFLQQTAQISEPTLDIDGDGILDGTIEIKKECLKDDFTEFKKDGTYRVNTYLNVCEDYGEKPNQDKTKGTWRIEGNKLITIIDNKTTEFTIISEDKYPNPISYNHSTKLLLLELDKKIGDNTYRLQFVFGDAVPK